MQADRDVQAVGARSLAPYGDQGAARAGRRALLGGLGVLGLAVAAPREASAGFGPGVSTTVSPPPVETLNLDDFFNLSEKKRVQRARAGKRQVKRLLIELETFDSVKDAEIEDLQGQLKDQELILRMDELRMEGVKLTFEKRECCGCGLWCVRNLLRS